MTYLLDTHTFLWFITDNPALSLNAHQKIEDFNNKRILSITSLWEIAIKSSIGKLELLKPFDELFPQQLRQNYIKLLAISLPHLAKLSKLPFYHKDPFDRLIIAQSIIENIPIISMDDKFDKYDIVRIW